MSLKHMKLLIVLVVGLLSVGCLTPEEKQKRLRNSVVGEYELKNVNGNTFKYIYLENGIEESYRNGKKLAESKWSIVKVEIHDKFNSGLISVFRINTDKSITKIEGIYRDGRRFDIPKERQQTFKKIK